MAGLTLPDPAYAAVASVLVAALAYWSTQRAKLKELRITQNAERRLKAYSDAYNALRDFRLATLGFQFVRQAQDDSRPLEKRFGDASIVASECLEDLELDRRLFQLMEAKDEAGIKRLLREMFLDLSNRIPRIRRDADQAMFACQLLMLDPDLYRTFDRLAAAMQSCTVAMWKSGLEAYKSDLASLDRVLAEAKEGLARNFAADFEKRW